MSKINLCQRSLRVWQLTNILTQCQELLKDSSICNILGITPHSIANVSEAQSVPSNFTSISTVTVWQLWWYLTKQVVTFLTVCCVTNENIIFENITKSVEYLLLYVCVRVTMTLSSIPIDLRVQAEESLIRSMQNYRCTQTTLRWIFLRWLWRKYIKQHHSNTGV